MATTYTKRSEESVIIHFSANGTVKVVGNNSVSNLHSGEAYANGDEADVTSAYIKQAWWGAPSGANAYWTVKRGTYAGGNTVLVLDSTGYHDYAGGGGAIKIDSTGDISANLTGSTAGFLQLEVQLTGDWANTYV
jgi:hypothetical protein